MRPEQELGQADLGDERLNQRLRQVAAAFSAAPAASIPQACAPAVDQAYRFLANPHVAPDAIRQAHYADTRARGVAAGGVLWLASDTTWLDFSTHPSTRGLGYQQRLDQAGLFLHSTLACTAGGTPLGLLDQQAFIRPPGQFGRRASRARRMTAAKESGRWLAAWQACQERLPAGVRAVFVADREADLFDLWAAPRRAGGDLLVRADGRRRLDGEGVLLGVALAEAPLVGALTVEVPGRAGQPGRTAVVAVRARPVRLAVPSSGAPGRTATPVALHAARAVESAPPPGVAPLDWLLLTTLEAGQPTAALEWVAAYRLRWRVEQYHFTLKSGCGVERLQLEERPRLERAAAVDSVVAVRLLRLTYQARQEPAASCERVLARREWQVLLRQVTAQFGARVDDRRPPPLAEAVYWLARLGGYVGRGRRAVPGVKVLWRGLSRLHDLVAGYQLAQAHGTDPPPDTTEQSSVER